MGLLLDAQVVDGVPQPLGGAPDGVDGPLELPFELRPLGLEHHDPKRRRGVGEILEDAVVQVAGHPVALGLPYLPHRLLGPLALGYVVYGPYQPRRTPPDGSRTTSYRVFTKRTSPSGLTTRYSTRERPRS